MPEEIDRQSIIDDEQLKLVSLGYMISAGVAAMFMVFGLFYIFLGVAMSIGFSHIPPDKAGNPPPAFMGWIFAGIGVVFFVLAAGMAVARFWAGRCVTQRKSRTFCLVIAALGCLEFPYGTALGVLSFIVLLRDSVARQFKPRLG